MGFFFALYQSLYNIRLLAFVCSVKANNRYSVISGKLYRECAAWGISGNTAGKYVQSLIKLGLARKTNRGIEIVKLTDCICALLCEGEIEKFRQFRHLHFFRKYRNELKTYRQYYNFIQIQIMGLNLRHQSYRRDRTQAVKDILQGKPVKIVKRKGAFIKKALKYYNCTSMDDLLTKVAHLLCLYPKNAVTGQFHLSKVIGTSSATANRRLRVWSKNELIERKVIFANTSMPITESSFRYANSIKLPVIPNPHTKTLVTILGSRVTVLCGDTETGVSAIKDIYGKRKRITTTTY